MHTPRAEPRRAAILLVFVTASAVAAALAAGGSTAPAAAPAPTSWRGLVGSRPAVAAPERVIVVLRTPSLAQRVAAAGGEATSGQERAWTADALGAQRRLLARLAARGVALRPEYDFARVLDGFSAVAGSGAVAVIERDPDVAGVYPVRVAYPASLSTAPLAADAVEPTAAVPGLDGRGTTIALLDTGVDPTVPFLHGRVLPGIDIVGGDAGALAAPRPGDPSQLERHGTEMAALLSEVATGALLLPVRVAGWQPDGRGHQAIYARSDQIVAGLDRAVDPNDDGDAHDAARIALLALAEPFAGFDDSPEAHAIAGALTLDTLVVAPAGNDGPAAAGFGDVSGPAGAPEALTVGAFDARPLVDETHLLARSGLATLADTTVPLANAAGSGRRLDLELAAAGGAPESLRTFFGAGGTSLVAGRAALVPMGGSPVPAARNAAAAGARAVVLYGGSSLPAGGLDLDWAVPVPVVAVPAAEGHAMLTRLRAGSSVTVVLRAAAAGPNPERGRVAGFSSGGIGFDGSVKPDLVAEGVALTAADPGENADGSTRFVAVNGSSAAAAVVAGAAALLAQGRPSLDARGLAGRLVGTARPLAGEPVTTQGAGRIDAVAAVAAGLTAWPATLAFGHATAAGQALATTFTLTNRSAHPIRARLTAPGLQLSPATALLAPGDGIRVSATATSGLQSASGAIVVRPGGGGAIRIPWAIAAASGTVDLIRSATLSLQKPLLLTVDAGRLSEIGGRPAITAVRELEVELLRADGTPLGVLARLHDVLPGRTTFALTGRGPTGRLLAPGRYEVRVSAFPFGRAPVSRKTLQFVLH
jgi:hypothetical protein